VCQNDDSAGELYCGRVGQSRTASLIPNGWRYWKFVEDPLHNPLRIDPATGLALPDPFPEYLTCPACGQAEVEVFCYQTEGRCHNCGALIAHPPPPGCGTSPYCRRDLSS
jgi:hypothetical protein